MQRIIFGVMLAMLLGALDQTIVATALPTIGEAFGDFTNLSWVVTAYLLASTAATPLYGKLSDIHGRRVMLLTAIAIFSLASAACALAPNLLVLIIARALQGLGGGALISLAQTIIADVVSPRERGRYQAQIAGVFAAASIAGPLLGGFFAQYLSWTLSFWINLPIGLAAFLMTDRALRRLPRHDRKHEMDFLGAGLMVVASVLLLLALGWGGVRYAWTSPVILGLLGATGVLSALFVWRMRAAREPFLPLELLADPVVGRGMAAAFMAVGAMVGLSIFVPLYFETGRGLSASQSGLGLIPLMGGVVCGAVVSGRAMARIKHYKRPALAGLGIATTGLCILALAPALPLVVLCALLALVGAGIGTVLPVCTVSIQNAIPPYRMGTATGVMTFFRQLGGALVVAVLGAVLLAALGAGSGAHDAESLARTADPATVAVGFQRVFGTVALVTALAALALSFLPERPLRASVHHAESDGGLV
ncbi:MDR family MFS transporter [Xanthobacter sp. KR7-65]|uniref:MDR family MFS transporter n=1 Tax=Xanthobacter sp. KR7-65 TaxID=3156612 RepID=UPI0032B4712B